MAIPIVFVGLMVILVGVALYSALLSIQAELRLLRQDIRLK